MKNFFVGLIGVLFLVVLVGTMQVTKNHNLAQSLDSPFAENALDAGTQGGTGDDSNSNGDASAQENADGAVTQGAKLEIQGAPAPQHERFIDEVISFFTGDNSDTKVSSGGGGGSTGRTADLKVGPGGGTTVTKPEKVLFYCGSGPGLGSPLNDVWSFDGATYLNLLPNTFTPPLTQWPPRWSCESFYFNNKVWLIGGEQAGSVNIWNSVDGMLWYPVSTNNLQVFNRSGFGVKIFNNEIWVFGGQNYSSLLLTNEVFHSSDGINWTQAPNAPWAPTRDFASVVFNNKIWLLGGADAFPNYSNQVWSFDGTTWTQAPNAPWAGRILQTSNVFNNQVWMTGGCIQNFCSSNEVWSFDGTTWTQAPNAPWLPRWGHTSFILNNKLWITSGFYSNAITNDTWSFDGVTWIQQLGTPIGVRYYMEAVVVPKHFGVGDLIPTALQWKKSPTGTPNNNPIPVNTTPYPQIYFVATISNPSLVPVTIPANSKITISTSVGNFGLTIAQTTMGAATTIAAGGTQQINMTSVTSPNIRASANTYALKLTIDQNNVVTESDETNNTHTQNLVVQ